LEFDEVKEAMLEVLPSFVAQFGGSSEEKEGVGWGYDYEEK